MAVKYFAHDDSPFESWLKEHPDGHVLNFYTTATGKVHSARCPSYQVAGRRMTSYVKACSTWRDSGNYAKIVAQHEDFKIAVLAICGS